MPNAVKWRKIIFSLTILINHKKMLWGFSRDLLTFWFLSKRKKSIEYAFSLWKKMKQ